MAYYQVKRNSFGGFSDPQTSSSYSSSNASKNTTAFKVAVRLRPLLAKERLESLAQCVSVELEHNAVVITKPEQQKKQPNHMIEINDFSGLMRPDPQKNSQNFFFDTVFGPNSSQEDVYMNCAGHIVLSVLEGYNGSIIAYGQTGTGKSYTIEGGNDLGERGLIPRSSEEIFSYIKNKASIRDRFLVRVSFLEIYNEKISDLLEQGRTNLRIREDVGGGMFVENLSEHVVKSTEDVKALIKKGTQVRTTAATRSNIESSRSHAIFSIIVEHAQSSDDGNAVTIGKLRLADLAGSEKYDVDSQSKRQEETKYINVSLHTFGLVVKSLTTASNSHIPYRDSKLTKILQDSLGGNCKTTMITTISPTVSSYNESLNSLKFAKRAKNVKNNAVINKDVSQKAQLSAYQQEIKKLREQLQSQGGSAVNTDQLMKLEKEKEMAEQMKDQVLSELQQQKLLYDKAEKQKHEYQLKIQELEEKLLHGGSSGSGDVSEKSDIQKVLEVERQEKIVLDKQKEYEDKLAQLEEEKRRLMKDKEEFQKTKEKMKKLQSQPNENHAAFFRAPNLPKPTLASQYTPPSAILNSHGGLRGLPSTGHLPMRRPISKGPATVCTPSIPLSMTRGTVQQQQIEHSTDQFYGANDYQVALFQYYSSLADPYTGIPCQELQASGIRVFTGTDAIEWFMGNMEGVEILDEALRIGNRLIELNMISDLQGGSQFRANSYYQFNDISQHYPILESSSRPISAYSTMSLAAGANQPLFVRQNRTASLPAVSDGIDSSFTCSSSSFATLNLSSSSSASPLELLDANELSANNPTELHIAAITGDYNGLRELAKTIDVDVQDSEGYTPLMYCALGNQAKCCTMLLKNLKANVNMKNKDHQTALMLAVSSHSTEVVKTLLKYKAETEHKIIDDGSNVFHIAAKSNSKRCLQYLLKYSYNLEPLNERDVEYHTPLHIAVINHQHDAITMLLKGKCDIGISDSEGQTPLHYAVLQDCFDCAGCILSITPNNVNLVDVNGMTSLHAASMRGLQNIAKLLMDCDKCDVNMSDNEGRTPLHYAVLGNNPIIIKVLLLNGANKCLSDKHGKCPEDYALEKKYKECINCFK